MNRRRTAKPAAEPVSVDLLARASDAAEILERIGTPEAAAAIAELAAAGRHMADAFRLAGRVILAAVPISPTEH